MSTKERYKRCLVRDMARYLYKENRSKEYTWAHLELEYGKRCQVLWQHMRTVTIKKLKRLLAAQDRFTNITRIARMTLTDWLIYDLVLVNENIDVIGEDMIREGKPEPEILVELVKLVYKYRIEDLSKLKDLVQAWVDLTQEYNNKGRECSPMLLQRRWYQLKQLSRSRFYKFWSEFHGNLKILHKANNFRLSPLQLRIVECYENLITKRFDQWSDLIIKKKVVQAELFEVKTINLKSSYINGCNPDVDVIEIDDESNLDIADKMDVDSKNAATNCSTSRRSSSCLVKKENASVTIKPPDEVILIDEEENITQQPHVEIPIKNNKELEDATSNKSIVKTEMKLPEITNVVGNVKTLESHKEFNNIIDYKDKVKIPRLDDKSAETSSETSLVANVVEPVKYKIEGNGIDCGLYTVPSLYNLPSELNFLDYGIEVMDEDIVNEEPKKHEDYNQTVIDKKLTMFPIMYTKKLEHMNIFKDRSYFSVQGDHIIKCVLAESKPIYKDIFSSTLDEVPDKAMNDNVDNDVNGDQSGNGESKSCVVPRVSYTSWLLQKPKSRSYNPIKLCKNPDFNTRLKRLTAGFFSIERNRQLFNTCKPLTVDLHKEFESKLIDKTLYLESSNLNSVKKIDDVCKNTMSDIPSVKPVQSLIAKSKVNIDNLVPKEMDEVKPICEVDSFISERVTNLLRVDQVCRISQNMLTAEISPISVSDPSFAAKPPVQLVKTISATSINGIQPSVVSMNDIRKVSPTLGENKKKSKVVQKGPKVTKPSTNTTMPPWWKFTQKVPEDEILITRDTFHKILCMLKGDDKPPQHGPKKKTKRAPRKRTAMYCCWARYEIEKLSKYRTRSKLEHECPNSPCSCCCYLLLSNEATCEEKTLGTINVVRAGPETISLDTTTDMHSNCSILKPVRTNNNPKSFADIPIEPALNPFVRSKNIHITKANIKEKPLSTSTETRPLLDDNVEPSNTRKLSSPSLPSVEDKTFETALPKGINLVLSSDNSLSVNINPDEVIGHDSLSKLPEICKIVEKLVSQMANKKQPQSNESDLVNSTTNKLNFSSKTSSEQNLQENIVHKEIGSKTLLNVTNNLIETGSNNINIKDFQEDSFKLCIDNSNKVSESVFNNINRKNQKTNQNGKQDEKEDSGRKTILSDLMTMSGISPDDVNVNNEEPIPFAPTINNGSPSDPTIADISGSKKKKTSMIIKKYVLYVNKKQKKRKLKNTFIDLTEDNDTTSVETKKRKNDPNSYSRKTIKAILSKIIEMKSIKADEIEKPPEWLNATLSSLASETSNVGSQEEYDSRMDQIIANQYMQSIKNLSSLKPSQDEIISIGCSDSSDDEPLAKKIKRTMEKNKLNNPEEVHKTADMSTDTGKAVHHINTIMFPPQPMQAAVENNDTGSDVNDECILGV